MVLWVDERFLFIPTDHEWVHIAPFLGKLLIHGLTGATALLIGPFQFSDRLRAARPKLHRWIGRTCRRGRHLGAARRLDRLSLRTADHRARADRAKGGFWFVCTLMALLCALRRQFAVHKVWMMRSYGLCLVFVMSRVPDAIPGFRWTDAFLAHTLWWLTAFALVGPDLILATRALWSRKRRSPDRFPPVVRAPLLRCAQKPSAGGVGSGSAAAQNASAQNSQKI